jgi:hypothetical protein
MSRGTGICDTGRHPVGLKSPTYFKGKFQKSRAVIPGRHPFGLESPTYFKGKFVSCVRRTQTTKLRPLAA